MDFSKFSLIYPENISDEERFSSKYRPDIDMFDLEELGLLEAFNIKSSELSEFFTMNTEVIKYRIDTFKDMIENESLSKTLLSLIPSYITGATRYLCPNIYWSSISQHFLSFGNS